MFVCLGGNIRPIILIWKGGPKNSFAYVMKRGKSGPGNKSHKMHSLNIDLNLMNCLKLYNMNILQHHE